MGAVTVEILDLRPLEYEAKRKIVDGPRRGRRRSDAMA